MRIIYTMPGKNIIKKYAPESYYHVYSRGVNKEDVFRDETDYTVFLGLLKRYLSAEESQNMSRHTYPKFNNQIKLLAFALMPNHIHLLLYQEGDRAIAGFMRSVMTSYGMYFNNKYGRVGPVFQSNYRASLVSEQKYLEHISRYIHLNPRDWRTSDKTTLKYYLNEKQADWISPEQIMELFKDAAGYLQFVSDYESNKEMLDELKWELANEVDN